MMNTKLTKLIGLGFLAAINTGCLGCTRVGPGYVGIVVNMAGSNKGVQDYPAKTGWVFYNVFSEEVIEYPVFVQTAAWTSNTQEGKPVNEEITFTNKAQMQISADISLSYHLEPNKVPAFYVNFRQNDIDKFTHGYLRNIARDQFNEIGGKYEVENIMGDNGPFLIEVRKALQKEVEPIGVKIDQFGFIGAPRPPKSIIDAINLKVQAQQTVLQKQIELAQVTADANKEVAKTEGYARAVLARAEAEATANRKISESITPQLIELRKLEKWNGVLPTVQGGTNGGIIMQLPGK
jgi:regulator of protease activity HflC (stomatin/prohibitin superfamily)